MLGLVAGQHSTVVGQLLAHGHHLLPEQGVLLLQEGRPHRYLVLLKPPGITGALGCFVILVPPTPILFILRARRRENNEVQRGSGHSERKEEQLFKGQRECIRLLGLFFAHQWSLLGRVPKGLPF